MLWRSRGRRILGRMGITLRSLETYGYIDSKTKSYWILREFLLLFIFYAFWPYKAGLPCFFDQQALLLITLFRPSFSGLSEFLDLFRNKPLGAPRPLSKSGLCPNNSLNHHRVPRHPSCGFKHLPLWPDQSSDEIHAQNAMKTLTSHSAVLAMSSKPCDWLPSLSGFELEI